MELDSVRITLTTVLLCVGTVGNILSIITVTNKHCKKSSYTVYLVGLAITDILALFMNVFFIHAQRGTFGSDLTASSPLFCKLYLPLLELSSAVSVWLIVFIALERVFVTIFPFKAKVICKPKNAMISTASMIVFFCLFYSHLLYGMQLQSTISPYDVPLQPTPNPNASTNESVSKPQFNEGISWNLNTNNNGSDDNGNGENSPTFGEKHELFLRQEITTNSGLVIRLENGTNGPPPAIISDSTLIKPDDCTTNNKTNGDLPIHCHDEDPQLDNHDEDPQLDNHDEDPQLDNHDEDPQVDCHDEDTQVGCHNEDPQVDCRDEDPKVDCRDEDPQIDNLDEDRQVDKHDEDSKVDCHDKDPQVGCNDEDPQVDCRDGHLHVDISVDGRERNSSNNIRDLNHTQPTPIWLSQEENSVKSFCVFVDQSYVDFFRAYIWAAYISCFVMPVFILVTTNAATWVIVYRSSGKSRTGATTQMIRRTRHIKLIISSLISAGYIIFVSPMCILLLLSDNYLLPLYNEEILAILQLNVCTSVTTVSTFFLYILSGKRFRKTFKVALGISQPST